MARTPETSSSGRGRPSSSGAWRTRPEPHRGRPRRRIAARRCTPPSTPRSTISTLTSGREVRDLSRRDRMLCLCPPVTVGLEPHQVAGNVAQELGRLARPGPAGGRRRWRAGEPRARGRRARTGRGSRVTRAARRWSSNRTSSAAVGVWATSTRPARWTARRSRLRWRWRPARPGARGARAGRRPGAAGARCAPLGDLLQGHDRRTRPPSCEIGDGGLRYVVLEGQPLPGEPPLRE